MLSVSCVCQHRENWNRCWVVLALETEHSILKQLLWIISAVHDCTPTKEFPKALSTWRLDNFSCNICICRRMLRRVNPIFLIRMKERVNEAEGKSFNGLVEWVWTITDAAFDMWDILLDNSWGRVGSRFKVQVKEVGRSCAIYDRAINLWSDDPIVWFTSSSSHYVS